VGEFPRKLLESTVPMTAAMTMGLNVLTLKSPSSTSTANMTPPIGALKTAARPAAATQPSKVLVLFGELNTDVTLL